MDRDTFNKLRDSIDSLYKFSMEGIADSGNASLTLGSLYILQLRAKDVVSIASSIMKDVYGEVTSMDSMGE